MRRIASPLMFASRAFRPRPIVSLDADGRIVDVSTWEEPGELAGVEFHRGVLLEPMVNAHCHLELSAMRGAIPPGGGLAAFVRAMSGLPRDVPGRGEAIRVADAAMWTEGVGAVADTCNGRSSFETKAGSRIVYRNFEEVFGLVAPSSSQWRDGLLTSAEDARSQRRDATSFCCSPWPGVLSGRRSLRDRNNRFPTPHSTYSLQTGLFARVVAAGEGPLSIHFMESPDEAALYRGRGGLHDWYRERGLPPVDFAGFGSPAGRLIAQVPPGRDLLLVHNTFITQGDLDRLADHFGSRLTMVLCPRSNLHITNTLPPVEMLRRKGVRIALGTDSLASNDSLSLIEELKRFPGVPLEERLHWATAGGREALGLEAPLPGVVLLEGFDAATGQLHADATARRLV